MARFAKEIQQIIPEEINGISIADIRPARGEAKLIAFATPTNRICAESELKKRGENLAYHIRTPKPRKPSPIVEHVPKSFDLDTFKNAALRQCKLEAKDFDVVKKVESKKGSFCTFVVSASNEVRETLLNRGRISNSAQFLSDRGLRKSPAMLLLPRIWSHCCGVQNES